MSAPRWIWEEDVYDYGAGGWKCSVCGAPNSNIGGNAKINPLIFVGSAFCPNCGEDMSGKEREEVRIEELGGETMDKLSTIQQLGLLNEVYRLGEKGPGGAYHTYAVARAQKARRDKPENPVVAVIKFQKGPRKAPDARTGVVDADLIEIVRDRLKCFQEGEYATKENALAIGYLEAALDAMNQRVVDRIERGVLGTEER